MSAAFYNEIEPYPATWMRNLIAAGHIAPGTVDERSIVDLDPRELAGYKQCHFFAGIGVWSYALRLAGWDDARSVWTGSCPCQPFSVAGKQRGTDDHRHLWPAWFRLIRECRPQVIFGEQVDGEAGRAWLDLVCADLEGCGYAIGPAVFPAAGVGAPHRRHRLYFVAYADDAGQRSGGGRVRDERNDIGRCGTAGELADSACDGRGQGRADSGGLCSGAGAPRQWAGPADSSNACLVGDTDYPRPQGRLLGGDGADQRAEYGLVAEDGRAGIVADSERDGGRTDEQERGPQGRVADGWVDPWADAEWIYCTDGFWRPVEPEPQQMADGFAESLGRLRSRTVATLTEEVARAVPDEAVAREAVRDLWLHHATQAVQRAPGRCRSLHEAPVLLAFMRELAREGWPLIDHLPPSCFQSAEAGLRELREGASAPACSPHRPRPVEQRAGEPADALSIVSHAVACALAQAWSMPHPLIRNAPARMGRLRAYGNAINAQQAAAFVSAAMEALTHD